MWKLIYIYNQDEEGDFEVHICVFIRVFIAFTHKLDSYQI